jgi:hypothetical protein
VLVADLHGKLLREELDLEWREDILTSSVFGTLQYLPRAVLAAILRQAGKRNPASRLAELNIDSFAEMCSFEFWPTCSVPTAGVPAGVVPDLILRTSAFVIVIECKLESRLGQDPTQLRREFQLTCRPVQEDGCVVAVTSPLSRSLFVRASAECLATVRPYVAPGDATASRVAWISWADISGAREECAGIALSVGERVLLDDLVAVLHRHNFRVFRGIRAPRGAAIHPKSPGKWVDTRARFSGKAVAAGGGKSSQRLAILLDELVAYRALYELRSEEGAARVASDLSTVAKSLPTIVDATKTRRSKAKR